MSDTDLTKLVGPSKSDQTLADMLAHPIWLWGLQVNSPEDADGVPGGDETGMRPWLGPPDVTHQMMLPRILLKIQGTDLWATGIYDGERRSLDALGVLGSNGSMPPKESIIPPGKPVTYIAVPMIEGKKDVAFKAKNRQRDEALMVGAFTPEEEARRYEQELATSGVFAGSAMVLIRQNHDLLKVAAAYIRRVVQDTIAESHGLVFTDVSGWLEEEDPTLFAQLLEEASVEGLKLRGFTDASHPSGNEEIDGVMQDKETGIAIVVIDWKDEGRDRYSVRGYWSKHAEHMPTVTHWISMVNGRWVAED